MSDKRVIEHEEKSNKKIKMEQSHQQDDQQGQDGVKEETVLKEEAPPDQDQEKLTNNNNKHENSSPSLPKKCTSCQEMCSVTFPCTSSQPHYICKECIKQLEDVYPYCVPLRCPKCDSYYQNGLFDRMPILLIDPELYDLKSKGKVVEVMREQKSNEKWGLSEKNFMYIVLGLILINEQMFDDYVYFPLCVKDYMDDLKKETLINMKLSLLCSDMLLRIYFIVCCTDLPERLILMEFISQDMHVKTL